MMTSLGKQYSSRWERASTVAIAVLLCLRLVGGSEAQNFWEQFTTYGFSSNIIVSANQQNLQLVLTPLSAAGFTSKYQYLFGSYGVYMKLQPGNSAGTVTTFYLSSTGNTHDEFDFEFLGNTSGQPYLIHTNIFSHGVGGREIQFYPWFDPTADYHYYGVQWNQDIVVFYVDDVPIREFKCDPAVVPFPNYQPVRIYGSIWDGSTWATQGGAVPLNWAAAPFIGTYQNFDLLKGCVIGWPYKNTVASCQKSSWAYPGLGSETLNTHRHNQLEWVKKFQVHYNYCADRARYPTPPPECAINIL